MKIKSREKDQPPQADSKLGSDVETTVNELVPDTVDHEDLKMDESATPSFSTHRRHKRNALPERSTTVVQNTLSPVELQVKGEWCYKI